MNLRRRLVGLALCFSLLLSVAAAPVSASPRQLNSSFLCAILSFFRTPQMTFAHPVLTAKSATFIDNLWLQFCAPV